MEFARSRVVKGVVKFGGIEYCDLKKKIKWRKRSTEITITKGEGLHLLRLQLKGFLKYLGL